MTLTLAIETSGIVGSIALTSGGELIAERTLQLGRHHGQSLIPELRQLLDDCGRKPCECNLIAVSIGPGSFTGLRVGVVCAKTLAYVTGSSIAAVDTFHAIACNTPSAVQVVHVVGDAQREDLFLGEFRRNAQQAWEPCGGVRLVNAAAYAATLQPGMTISGSGIEKIAHLLPGPEASSINSGADHELVGVLSPDLWRPTASVVARLGEERAAAGCLTDAWALEPLYLRRSSAEDKWEQKNRR